MTVILSLAVANSAPGAPSPTLLYIFAAMLAGGALELGWRIYMRMRTGTRDDALQIASAAHDAAESSQRLFVQYKVELEDSKEQLNHYLEQLISVNRELGAAMAGISKLERDLADARGESAQLREQLADAKSKRDELLAQVHSLQERIRVLETA